MERSVLGSAVKTYGGRNGRYSRSSYSYRPSGLIGSYQNIFEDEDVVSPFDRLLHEDKTKQTFVQATPLKNTFDGTIDVSKTSKFKLHEDLRSTALKNVQNVRNDTALSTKSSVDRRHCSSSRSYANKENSIRCRNPLFLSDSDSSVTDEFDYNKTVIKKSGTAIKKKRKKYLLCLKNTSRAINQSDKRKRRQEYREKHKNISSKNSNSSKSSFVKANAGRNVFPTNRRTFTLDRKSISSLAQPLSEECTENSEINFGDKFKPLFGKEFQNFLAKLENPSPKSASLSTSEYVPVDTSSEESRISSSRLSPVSFNYSVIDQFCPGIISTPRQSSKFGFKISAPSPIHNEGLRVSKPKEFDPNDLSQSLLFIKDRLSARCEEMVLCEEFEKSCSLHQKLSGSNLTPENNEKSSSSEDEIPDMNSTTCVEIEKVNAPEETNHSLTSSDLTPQTDDEISRVTESCESTQKNDETESHCMSIESTSSDHSKYNVTVEMKSPEKFISENSDPEIFAEPMISSSLESNASVNFSDSADEKFETIVEKVDIRKRTDITTVRDSVYTDSFLQSVIQPSNSKSSVESGYSTAFHFSSSKSPATKFSNSVASSCSENMSPRPSVASCNSSAESSPMTTSFSSVPGAKSSLGGESSRSSVASHLPWSESANISASSSKVSLDSDSSGTGELTLTVLEKTCSATILECNVSSPDFAGFETSTDGATKLAAFKRELDRLQNIDSSPISPSPKNSPLPDTSIERSRLEGPVLPSEQSTMSYCRSRYSGIIRPGRSSRKSVRFDTVSKFEPVLEENAEDSTENENETDSRLQTTVQENVSQCRSNFTDRRRKRCPLPTLSEADTEIDDGPCISQNGAFERVSPVREENQTHMRSPPIILAKGKKWRRSFLMLKNVRDFGYNLDISDEESKGRCWRPTMEHLIQSQMDATALPRELDECTVLRTGFDGGKTTSGFEEGDTLTEKSIYSRRSRGFSLSICVESSRRRTEITGDSILDVSSLARLAYEAQESFLAEVDVSAGDHFRNCSLPRIDFSVPHRARDIVLRYCQQDQPLPFEECFDESVLRSCRKIGEGVYGEVFSLKTRSKSSVIKIIPVEGEQKVNGERQKRFDEILSELVISLELSNLRKRKDYYTNCFAQVQRCWCVQGRYPSRLISLWKEYDQAKGSDNDSPKIFKDDQLFVILELNNGGEDLESFVFNNAQQSLSVFKQVANALAVAEQAFKFEHRDLHWGNVLVSPTKDREACFKLRDKSRFIQLHGVKVTIIDYTLSRISVNNHTLYNNIGEDPELFTAEGDFQFEVYRLMRKEVNDIWDRYVPKTNVIWLYYLIDKMINEVRYRRDYTKIHHTNVEKLKRLYASVLKFESSCEFVENQPI